MQKVHARLQVAVPDRIAKFPEPSSRWVVEHKAAYGPGICALTIHPTIGSEDKVRNSMRDLLIGIEYVDNTHSALLFMFPLAGDVAYVDNVHPSLVGFCHCAETNGGRRHEFYKPNALIGFDAVISHYQNEDMYQPFDYRWLTRWHQTEEKYIIEFDKEMPPMRLVMRDRATYKP